MKIYSLIYKLVILLLLTLLVVFKSNAQHFQFSQFYASPVYLNPAFAGANVCSRVCTAYRDQWPSIPGQFVTYQFSYDDYIAHLHSGVGLVFFNDKTGYGGLTSTMISGLYAYELNINRYVTARFGLQAGVVQRKVDFDALLFGDQISRGGNVPTIESTTPARTDIDFSSGAIVFTKRQWLGISTIHLNQHNQSLLEDNISYLPMEFRMHGGNKYYIAGDVKSDHEMSYTVAFNYKAQRKFDQLDLGFYYTNSPLVLGLWYRGIPLFKSYKKGYSNDDALCFLVGLTHQRLRIGYSYDLTISKLTPGSGGSHEVTLGYELCKQKRKKRIIQTACPKF